MMDLRRRLDLRKVEGGGEKIIVVELGKVAVGVVVDSVTEVSTIAGADIEEHMEVTTTLDEYVIGVGKQGENLVVILNLAKLISDAKKDLPEQRKAANKELIIAEQVPIV